MNWTALFRDALKNQSELESFLETKLPSTPYPIYIPKSFAEKIKKLGPESALWKQFVPSESENELGGLKDPIGDSIRSQTRGVVHRYENRLLFFPTSFCPIQCRYCFRKNELHENDELFIPKQSELQSYLAAHTEVDEVIFSGGDPLVLSDDVLFRWLDVISEYEHIKYIRFHTRMPVIIPERLSADFLGRLEGYKARFEKIIFVIHCNHVQELDAQIETHAKVWRKTPFEFLTQSVLLRGVNDSSDDLLELFKRITKLDWRPYYLHHPDPAMGALHFTMEQKIGLEIFSALRSKISGWGLPSYVVDSADASGKALVN